MANTQGKLAPKQGMYIRPKSASVKFHTGNQHDNSAYLTANLHHCLDKGQIQEHGPCQVCTAQVQPEVYTSLHGHRY